MTKNGWVLKFASAELRADREIVLAAVKQDGWALAYASAELQADRELILTAMDAYRLPSLCACDGGRP